MKAYWIDTPNKQILEVDYNNDYKTISREWLKCDLFTIVGLKKGDTLYVDDEGLLNDNPNGWFRLKDYPNPLVGYGLVLGSDKEGESTSPHITLEALQDLVIFPDKELEVTPEMLETKIYPLDENLRIVLPVEEDLERVFNAILKPLKAFFEEDEDLDPEFDPMPMFFIVHSNTIHAINPGDSFNEDRHEVFKAMSLFAQHMQKENPDARVMAAMLCAGWTLDPVTLARVGENVLINIETATEKCLLAYFKVTRRLNQPPLLTLDIKDIADQPNEGRMSNFFDRKLEPIETSTEKDS